MKKEEATKEKASTEEAPKKNAPKKNAPKDLYGAYSKEIMKSISERYNVNAKEAKKVLEEDGFEEKFLASPNSYEFIEPSKMARIIFNRVTDERRAKQAEEAAKKSGN